MSTTVLVTGSAGHLGEGLIRTLPGAGYRAIGLDLRRTAFTHYVGSITDREFVDRCMAGVDAVVHTATLHKPHVATHRRQDFVDVNVTGTLNLLEAATTAGVGAFVFTSTTSAFGRALTPDTAAATAWIIEDVVPLPRNIYGVTKVAAETLCEMFHRQFSLPCLVLRTSRFFPEPDDDGETRRTYDDANVKLNELSYRRADIEDGEPAGGVPIRNPFTRDDLRDLRTDAPAVLRRRAPGYEDIYRPRGWSMFPGIDRVYVNERARRELGWQPRYDFARAIEQMKAGQDPRSELARTIGSKGYHDTVFADGPYPVS